ncbi:sirohydrochlorin ferrochelatase [Anoxybacillus calidus]|jgi:sirohydrochlorin ferrochelatase|uniref:Sirohydrochlorin ferrochelatase n=1 Tax=[Anoxybacillus] calidus TaxID=575178 RepID=A0A7V9Z1T3_9BACL|nr:sirohydrochlorin chelatase [Anoxybacillus calidus]MBA2872534.1 sirohydrochlorin ferrochelatase [Anoxybacillus calidus]
MQAILYVCHGSRIIKACQEAAAFIDRCKTNIDIPIQEISFIELAEPDIAKGIDTCVNKGATSIAVIPVLLLAAGHVKHDIPEEVAKAKQRYPHIDIVIGDPFGVHEKMVQILIERIAEQSVPFADDATVLLVGRGSSDPDIKRDLQKIAYLLQEKMRLSRVEICFLAAAHPSLEEGLHRALHSEYKKIFVVPYLLFTGVLMEKLKKKLKNLSTSDKQFILCNYLGYHPLLQEVLYERVNKLVSQQYKNGLTHKCLPSRTFHNI